MNQFKRNISANFIGKFWTTGMSLALIPLYIKFLGIEAYGLIGFYATLQSVCSLLGMGLSTTLNKEVARLSVTEGKSQEIRDLVKTLETIYWLLAVVIAVLVSLLAPVISKFWINPHHLSIDVVRQAVLVMGLLIALQFPLALYAGGLLGLQRQVLYNGVLVTAATLSGAGVVLILWLVSPTVQAFFLWQAGVALLQTILSWHLLWKSLPGAVTVPKFQIGALHSLWRFAVGMAGISAMSFILMQMDKVILSKLLTLEAFGYYSLASVVASGLYTLITPTYAAVFPRFSQMVSLGHEQSLTDFYHRACQLMSVIVLPAAIIMVLFAPEVLQVWTHNPLIVQKTHMLVSALIIGTALNGLVYIPYAIQLSHDLTKFTFYQALIEAILLVPLMFWATKNYGALGAACVWIVMHGTNTLISVQVTHMKFLKGQSLRWYYQDVGLPLSGSLIVALMGRWLFPTHAATFIKLALLFAIFVVAVLSAVLTTPLKSEMFALLRLGSARLYPRREAGPA